MKTPTTVGKNFSPFPHSLGTDCENKLSNKTFLTAMKMICLISLILVVIVTACKKNAENSVSPDKRTLLTSPKWLQISGTVTPAQQGGVTTTFPLGATCADDNLILFKSDGNVVFDEGPTKCNVSDRQQIEYAKWQFSAEETRIIFDDGVGVYDAEILELNKNRLKLRYQFDELGKVYTYEDTYVAK